MTACSGDQRERRRRIGPIGELPINAEDNIVFPSGTLEAQRNRVINALAQYRALCYMEFLVSVVNDWGRSRFLQFMERMEAQHDDPAIRILYGLPEDAAGEPPMFVVKNNDVMRMLQHGDEIERFQGNDFVVSVYSIWDELVRPSIAETFDVAVQSVRSNLMGDIRIIRHAIIHKKGRMLPEDVRNLQVLGQGWIQYAEDEFWQITPPMRRSLIAQIQSLDLKIQRPGG